MIARQRRQRGVNDPQAFVNSTPTPPAETLTPTSYSQGLRAAKKDLYSPSVTPQESPQQNYPSYYTQSGDYQLDNPVETLSYQSSPSHGYSNLNGGSFYAPSDPFPDVEMTCRDRTAEFFRIVEEERLKRQGAGAAQGNRPKPLARRSEFMNIAKAIGVDISNTYAKLEKLTILAKKKSLFDDRPVEIQDLTYIIKQDISSLNKQIAQLQEFSKSRDENSQHAKKHSSSVVVSLQSKLANMSKSFKQVLEIRTENLKHQKERRDQFSSQPPIVSSALPPRNAQGGALMSATRHSPGPTGQTTGATNGSFLIDMDGDDSSGAANGAAGGTAAPTSHMQQQMAQLALMDETDSYIQERSDAMQNIESTVVELGQIFTQLATMVKEQEEMIQRIDANVADTELNVEAAHGEILKYFQSVTSNRWLMIKVFLVLIVFFIIFIVFLA